MIRVGIGGWTYEPWCGTFYPAGLPKARELAYACERLTSIEINGTFYRTQKPDTFRKWAAEAPDHFVFSLKGPRYATNRTRLAEAGPSIDRFVESGITELGPKLGPILWQFAPKKKNSTRRTFPRSSTCCRPGGGRAKDPARGGGAPRQLLHAGPRGAAAPPWRARRLRRRVQVPGYCRFDRRLRLCPPAALVRGRAGRIPRRSVGPLGGAFQDLGGRGRARRPAARGAAFASGSRPRARL